MFDAAPIDTDATPKPELYRLLARQLDTLIAGERDLMRGKLDIFADEIEKRQVVAARYAAGLAGLATPPAVIDGAVSAWAQYTIKVANRDAVAAALKDRGVPTAVYYPVSLSDQPAYAHYPRTAKGAPVSAALTHEVLSLPMHPYMDEATQDRILAAVKEAVAA